MLDLQAETVKQLLLRIKAGQATSSELNVARQLLKDNEISVDFERNEGLADLHETLPIFTAEDTPWSSH